MEKKRINFLRFLSRPRLILIYEMDMVMIVLSTLISTYVIMNSLGLPLPLIIALSFVSAYFAKKILDEVREGNELRGSIKHFLFSIDILKPRLDAKIYPELARMDSIRHIPYATEGEFFN